MTDIHCTCKNSACNTVADVIPIAMVSCLLNIRTRLSLSERPQCENRSRWAPESTIRALKYDQKITGSGWVFTTETLWHWETLGQLKSSEKSEINENLLRSRHLCVQSSSTVFKPMKETAFRGSSGDTRCGPNKVCSSIRSHCYHQSVQLHHDNNIMTLYY